MNVFLLQIHKKQPVEPPDTGPKEELNPWKSKMVQSVSSTIAS